MNTDFTEQPDSSFQIGLKDGRAMTNIPKPVKRPFRRLEIITGLICMAAGILMLAQFGLWLSGAVSYLLIGSKGEAALLLFQSVYLIGFSFNLLRSGHVALVFWMIAIAILISLPLTTGLFG